MTFSVYFRATDQKFKAISHLNAWLAVPSSYWWSVLRGLDPCHISLPASEKWHSHVPPVTSERPRLGHPPVGLIKKCFVHSEEHSGRSFRNMVFVYHFRSVIMTTIKLFISLFFWVTPKVSFQLFLLIEMSQSDSKSPFSRWYSSILKLSDMGNQ